MSRTVFCMDKSRCSGYFIVKFTFSYLFIKISDYLYTINLL